MVKQNLVIVESPTKAKTIERYLGKNFKVVASKGHLRDLPKSKMGVDIEHNYEPHYISIRGKGDLIKSLKKEAAKADAVYLASDPDREGEAISWHLAHLLGLDLNAPIRVEFNEITKDAIKEAFKNPRFSGRATSTSYFRPSCGLYFISYFMEESEKRSQCRACSKYRCEINY